ncbi:Hypothetical predicted protein [Xyrichtys novacula]|uniref:Uncharacterized protein n=1 Tax=Xyrichtys novacula TaxID=13765 RepID=A0AAV1GFG0_XYRNO|nr:Hypothetical predicted protein [Xyrichtys novacula]
MQRVSKALTDAKVPPQGQKDPLSLSWESKVPVQDDLLGSKSPTRLKEFLGLLFVSDEEDSVSRTISTGETNRSKRVNRREKKKRNQEEQGYKQEGKQDEEEQSYKQEEEQGGKSKYRVVGKEEHQHDDQSKA